jgi:hypothetical protein
VENFDIIFILCMKNIMVDENHPYF